MSARTALERAKAQFDFYERQHTAKVPALEEQLASTFNETIIGELRAKIDDAQKKATVNRDFAAELQAEIDQLDEDDASTTAEQVSYAMSETAPSWGYRLARVLGIIGLNYGTAEQLDWGMLRDAHRQIGYNPTALAAFSSGKVWPPLQSDFAVWKGDWRPEMFRIKLPDQTWAEIRPDASTGFEVWIIDPEHHEGEYRSAGFKGEHAFERAVRNIMDPVWEAALPF